MINLNSKSDCVWYYSRSKGFSSTKLGINRVWNSINHDACNYTMKHIKRVVCRFCEIFYTLESEKPK